MNNSNAAPTIRQPFGFNEIHEKLPNEPGYIRREVAEGLSEDLWTDLRLRVEDRRWLAGDDAFRSGRTKPKLRLTPRQVALNSGEPSHARKDEDLDSLLDSIRSLTYAEYAPAIAGVEALPGGRTRCPLPDHDDSNPSASWKGNLWHCHRCGEGGDLILLASRVSGIDTRGGDFIELVKWIGDRLITQAAAITGRAA